MKNSYDVIVVGLGTMGSASSYHLAKSGLKVLGLEQFVPHHTHGSFSGHTRIIRKAYYEAPDYVPLLHLAYNQWEELEEISGKTLFHKTGLMYLDTDNGPIGNGVLESSSLHHLSVRPLNSTEKSRYSSVFKIEKETRMLWEEDAGFVDVDETLGIHYHQALNHGAELVFGAKVLSWDYTPDGVVVIDNLGNQYTSSKLVLTAGAYSNPLLEKVGINLRITAQALFWFETHLTDQEEKNMPCWTYCIPGDDRIFYGFPQYGKQPGLKVAYHSLGKEIDPAHLSSLSSKADKDLIYGFVHRYLPGICKKILVEKTCLYTNTPDEHFIIDYIPDSDQKIIVATGFSGHGFKFVPAIGKLISDMAQNIKSNLDLSFLQLKRFMA